jgi:hypothetical protein
MPLPYPDMAANCKRRLIFEMRNPSDVTSIIKGHHPLNRFNPNWTRMPCGGREMR